MTWDRCSHAEALRHLLQDKDGHMVELILEPHAGTVCYAHEIKHTRK